MSVEWKTGELGELCDISLGRTPARAEKKYWDENRQTSNVWLSIADLQNTENKRVLDSKEYLSDEGAALCKVVAQGTLLVSFKLTLGRLAFAGRDLYTNEAIAALTVCDEQELSKEYLFYYLCFFDWRKAAAHDLKLKGVTLNKAKVKKLLVHYPSLPEQERIVGILDEALDSIATADVNTVQSVRNARDLFESYRERVFAERGEGWVEKRLSELCDIKHGFAFRSEFFTTSGDFVLLTPGNFYESGGYWDRGEKQKYYAGEIPDGFVLAAGDLLVAMTEQAAGLLGSPALIPQSGKFLHNQRLGLVSKKPDVPWTNEFFFHVFNNRAVRKAIHDSATGVKVRHTSPKKIGEVTVAFPTSIAEQKRVVATLTELATETQRLESIHQHKRIALEELKKSMLHHALTGQLGPQAA